MKIKVEIMKVLRLSTTDDPLHVVVEAEVVMDNIKGGYIDQCQHQHNIG